MDLYPLYPEFIKLDSILTPWYRGDSGPESGRDVVPISVFRDQCTMARCYYYGLLEQSHIYVDDRTLIENFKPVDNLRSQFIDSVIAYELAFLSNHWFLCHAAIEDYELAQFKANRDAREMRETWFPIEMDNSLEPHSKKKKQ